MKKLFPTKTIGIIGGGQLGKMLAMAASSLGYRTCIFTDNKDSPAIQVTDKFIYAPYNDKEALREFCKIVDVVTYEFENIPFESVKFLEANTLVRPNWNSLYISQNRIREKKFLTDLGIKTAEYIEINSKKDLQDALEKYGFLPSILKTAEMGYDGKGQFFINEKKDILFIPLDKIGSCVLEKKISFVQEISVIIARNEDGQMTNFPPTTNIHKNGILHQSIYPAKINANLSSVSIEQSKKIAQHLELVGLLAVEYFVTKDNELLVNEIAPRPHNSGHWTMDACYTSQFEQHIRAICGLDFGDSSAFVDTAYMQNLIGNDMDGLEFYLKEPRTKIHIYGKDKIKVGRKMGHFTVLASRE